MRKPTIVLVFASLLATSCATPVRKNIVDLTPTELAAFEQALGAMRAAPTSDPLSFDSFAPIHGSFCPHGDLNFLPWHRAYLQHFERALKQFATDKSVMLPYWDWSTTQTLPAPLTSSASPLFDTTRPATPQALDDDIIGVAAIDDILGIDAFDDFSYGIEAPHGHVHVRIGCPVGATSIAQCGNFRNVPTAAFDPVFWLHHANVDRQWAMWQKCHAGDDPTDTAWLNEPMTFPAVGTLPASRRNSEVLSIASLNYTYSGLKELDCSPFIFEEAAGGEVGPPTADDPAGLRDLLRAAMGADPDGIVLAESTGESRTTADAPATMVLQPTPLFRQVVGEVRQKSDLGRRLPRLRIALSGIDVTALPPAAIVKFYLGKPGATSATPSGDKAYIGSLALFALEQKGRDPANASLTIDVSRGVQAIVDAGGEVSLTITVTIGEGLEAGKHPLTIRRASLMGRIPARQRSP